VEGAHDEPMVRTRHEHADRAFAAGISGVLSDIDAVMVAFLGNLYGLVHEWPQDAASCRALIGKLRTHSLASAVYARLKAAGRLAEMPAFFREELGRIHQACFVQNLLIRHETAEVLRRFEEAGVPAIPLKGTVLAEHYFGHFAARPTSDIDLLVRRRHLDEAARLVQEAGYTRPEASSPVHYHTEWCKEAPGWPEPVSVELHWDLAQAGVSAVDVEALWQESEPLDGFRHIRVLAAEATFYTLCLHGASHLMDSGKHVFDLLHMLCEHGHAIDLARVLDRARRDRTQGRVKAALAVLYGLYPALHRLKPLPGPLPAIRWPGFGDQTGRVRRFRYSLGMLDTPRDKWLHLSRLLFPSRQLAVYSAGESGDGSAATYIRLYRQRLRSLFGGRP